MTTNTSQPQAGENRPASPGSGGPVIEGRPVTLPELPPIRRYDIGFTRGGETTLLSAKYGDYCDNDDREARERILVAEIERLRAECEAIVELANVARDLVDASRGAK